MNRFILFLLLVPVTRIFAQAPASYEQQVPGSNVIFKMVGVPAGTFTLGAPAADGLRDPDEVPQVQIMLNAFWIGEHEVTFGEWDAFFKNMSIPQTKNITVDAISRPTAQYIDLTWGMGRDSRNPTNSMSQQAALMYCKWLYEQTGIFYRLPTEAEWEYACKAGKDDGPSTQELASQGWFNQNSGSKYHKVKGLKPNGWGIYDMLGNLSEWTLDQYDPDIYEKLPAGAADPVTKPAARYPKVVRGGSYLDEAKALRCTNRIASDPSWNKRDPQIPKSKWWLTDGMGVGFRIVRPVRQPSAAEIDKFFSEYLK